MEFLLVWIGKSKKKAFILHKRNPKTQILCTEKSKII